MGNLKSLDLFSGIGGFALGLERAGLETMAFCEIDPYCQKVLNKHWPETPIHKDVRKINGRDYNVDLVCGGFPCQPHSSAARGRNPEDYLASEFGRVCWETKPKYVIAENVQKKAFPRWFVDGFRELDYEVYPVNISANEVGAPHRRNRWWFCAYPHDKSELPSTINAETRRMSELQKGIWGAENYRRAVRVSNGLSHRVDRLRCLGNAVIPAIPEIIGRAIMIVEG